MTTRRRKDIKDRHMLRRPGEKPPTFAQRKLIYHLYTELGRDVPSPSTRAGAAACIDQARRLADTRPPVAAVVAPPTERQLHDLRVYCNRLGIAYEPPADAACANRLLIELRERWEDR